MIYNPGTPQATDLPSDSQEDFLLDFTALNQFFGVDHIPFGNQVQFATNANPCVCTSIGHGLTTGNTINIKHFGSLVGDIIELWDINSGGPYTVTVIDDDTFSMNANASANPPYLENTGAFSCLQFNYGFHKKVFYPGVLNVGPNTSPPLGSPYSALYPKSQSDLAQLFFQNSPSTAFEKQMTQLNLVERDNAAGKGIITPFGIRINFGQVQYASTNPIFDFPIPFTSEVWAIVGTLQVPSPSKDRRYFWVLNALGLTQFSAFMIHTSSAGIVNDKKPGWYLAIGV